MSKQKLTKAELKRLEQLKSQLDLQQKKIEGEKQKLKKKKSELEAQQRKITNDKKELKNQQAQLKQDREFFEKQGRPKSAKSNKLAPRSSSNRKSDEAYAALKKKYEHMSKQMRTFKKKSDQLEAENKVLRRRAEAAGKKKLPTNDKHLKSLMKENKWLKKKLRQLLKELNKQKRWYARVVKVFKDKNEKWAKKRIEAYADKQYIIKYVFVDDIKRIVLTRPGYDSDVFKPRIRFKNGKGGDVIVRNVGIDIVDLKKSMRDKKGKTKYLGNKSPKNKNKSGHDKNNRHGKDGKIIDKSKIKATDNNKNGKNKKGDKTKNKKGKKDGKDGKDGKDDKNVDPSTAEFLASGDGDGDSTLNVTTENGGDGHPDADDIPDPDDATDEYMVDFMQELGFKVDLSKNPDPTYINFDVDDSKFDDNNEDALIDAEMEKAMKTDKEFLFDGDAGAPELEAQIIHLIGEMDNRNDDLNKIRDINNGVIMLDTELSGDEDEVQEQHLETTKEKLDALNVVFDGIKSRQNVFLASLEDLHYNIDTIKPINDRWIEFTQNLATTLIMGGGGIVDLGDGDGDSKANEDANVNVTLSGYGGLITEANFEKLRYFVDYFMKELMGRMYDLRCINVSYYNQLMKPIQNDDDSKDDDEPKAGFEILETELDVRHSSIKEDVSNDEVIKLDESDKTDVDKQIETVLNNFMSNNEDWKALIDESRMKHQQWLEKRTQLTSALFARHQEIGELMNKINNVPSYSMNLDKYTVIVPPSSPKDDTEIESENESDNAPKSPDNDENENENENGDE